MIPEKKEIVGWFRHKVGDQTDFKTMSAAYGVFLFYALVDFRHGKEDSNVTVKDFHRAVVADDNVGKLVIDQFMVVIYLAFGGVLNTDVRNKTRFRL